MGAALPIAAIALEAGGKVMKGIGERKELRSAAKVDEANAQLDLLEGEDEALSIRMDERAQAGDAMAAMASSGLLVGQGSPADIVADSAFQRELDILKVRKKAYGEFNNDMRAAKDKRKAGRNALIGSVFGAVSGALQSAAGMRNARALRAQGATERASKTGGNGAYG